MYLATYKQAYWDDGRRCSSGFITADTLDELRQNMAKTHYDARFEEADQRVSDYDGEFEADPLDKTFGWRVFKFEQSVDIETLPEFLKLAEEREMRHAARLAEKAQRKAEEDEAWRVGSEKWELETYNRLKEKFEGASGV